MQLEFPFDSDWLSYEEPAVLTLQTDSFVAGHSEYLYDIYASPEIYIEKCTKMRQLITAMGFAGVDAIAFRGSSGAAFGFPLAMQMKLSPIYVRKEKEATHGMSVEGPRKRVNSYIIVDDLVASGNTVKAILEKLGHNACGGIFLYRDVRDFGRINDVPVFRLEKCGSA